MTNAADGNAIVVYSRAADGTLTPQDSVATGGAGTGAGLGSQGGLALSKDDQWLLAVNAGSDDVTVFAVTEDGLRRTDRVPAEGHTPISVTLSGSTVYVLNGGSATLTGFTLDGRGKLHPLRLSRRQLSSRDAVPAQVEFSPDGRTLLVTEKNTNRILSFEVGFGGYLSRARVQEATGETPFGFAFGRRGQVFVSQAAGGAPGASSVGAYHTDAQSRVEPVEDATPTLNTAACWVAVSIDNRFAYTTNTGSSTVTGFRIGVDGSLGLLESDGVTAQLPAASAPIDMAFTDDGRFLYVLGGGSGTIHGYAIQDDGSLVEVGEVGGLPAGVSGLVAR